MRSVWIFDIDGVIANVEHRLEFLKKGDHRRFYFAAYLDPLESDGKRLLDRAMQDDDIVIFATGRPEMIKTITERWLEDIADVPSPTVFYRKNGDYAPSPLIKVQQVSKIMEQLKNEKVEYGSVFFVDDDIRNVKAVCDAFPRVRGLTFGTERLKELKGEF